MEGDSCIVSAVGEQFVDEGQVALLYRSPVVPVVEADQAEGTPRDGAVTPRDPHPHPPPPPQVVRDLHALVEGEEGDLSLATGGLHEQGQSSEGRAEGHLL